MRTPTARTARKLPTGCGRNEVATARFVIPDLVRDPWLRWIADRVRNDSESGRSSRLLSRSFQGRCALLDDRGQLFAELGRVGVAVDGYRVLDGYLEQFTLRVGGNRDRAVRSTWEFAAI